MALRNAAATSRHGIHAGVRVEALVLDRQHRLPHPERNRGERHVAALLARAVGHQRRQQRWVELHGLDVAPARDLDLLDSARRAAAAGRRVPSSPDAAPESRCARNDWPADLHAARSSRYCGRPRTARARRSAGAARSRGRSAARRDRSTDSIWPAPQVHGAAVDAGQRPLALAVEPLLDDVGVGEKEVEEAGEEDEREDTRRQQPGTAPSVCGPIWGS